MKKGGVNKEDVHPCPWLGDAMGRKHKGGVGNSTLVKCKGCKKLQGFGFGFCLGFFRTQGTVQDSKLRLGRSLHKNNS